MFLFTLSLGNCSHIPAKMIPLPKSPPSFRKVAWMNPHPHKVAIRNSVPDKISVYQSSKDVQHPTKSGHHPFAVMNPPRPTPAWMRAFALNRTNQSINATSKKPVESKTDKIVSGKQFRQKDLDFSLITILRNYLKLSNHKC